MNGCQIWNCVKDYSSGGRDSSHLFWSTDP
jgi:hypothetical protein